MVYGNMTKDEYEANEAVHRIIALGYPLQHMAHEGNVLQPLTLDEVVSAVNDAGGMIVRDAETVSCFMCDLPSGRAESLPVEN